MWRIGCCKILNCHNSLRVGGDTATVVRCFNLNMTILSNAKDAAVLRRNRNEHLESENCPYE